MLATMVMLGMQRIVIESGRLNASMRFHIDTRSAANSEEGSRFDLQNRVDASAHYGAGAWGMEAKMTNTIGYVSTQKNQTSEEMNTDLDLNSSVELYFKTDYVPLDRLAGAGQVDRIKVNTLNPDAEEKAAIQAREQRISAARTAETSRGAEFQKNLQHMPGDVGPESKANAPAPATSKADAATPKTDAATPKTDPAAKPKEADQSKSKGDQPKADSKTSAKAAPPPPADSTPKK
jgi:hypothetical protein